MAVKSAEKIQESSLELSTKRKEYMSFLIIIAAVLLSDLVIFWIGYKSGFQDGFEKWHDLEEYGEDEEWWGK